MCPSLDLSSSTEEQNQLKFAGLPSPESKRKFVKAMFDVKMLRFEREKAELKKPGLAVDVDDDEVLVLEDTPSAPTTLKEACTAALDDGDSVNGSPGDNRVRNCWAC